MMGERAGKVLFLIGFLEGKGEEEEGRKEAEGTRGGQIGRAHV